MYPSLAESLEFGNLGICVNRIKPGPGKTRFYGVALPRILIHFLSIIHFLLLMAWMAFCLGTPRISQYKIFHYARVTLIDCLK